jgi:hypothetical protein
MVVPKNVRNNNVLRASLVDCASLALVENPNALDKSGKTVFGWVLGEHRIALADFVKTHQDTCAVYEIFMTKMLLGVLEFCVFTCPRCGKQLKVEVGG